MNDLIIIAGAPGSGKSTLAGSLKEKLSSVEVEFSALRNFHLDHEWKNKSQAEEQLSFENFMFIVRNYLSHGYKNIIIHDLQDFRVQQVFDEFKNSIIITLVTDDSELERRIVNRNEGFKDTVKAIEWNRNLKKAPLLPNEYRIDNTVRSAGETLKEALNILAKSDPNHYKF